LGSAFRFPLPPSEGKLILKKIQEGVVQEQIQDALARRFCRACPVYTTREGGELLKAAAVKNLQTAIKKAQAVGSTCLFSIRHDFPSAWAKFQSTAIGPAELSLTLTPELYPFLGPGHRRKRSP
jgi:hypothetical protein